MEENGPGKTESNHDVIDLLEDESDNDVDDGAVLLTETSSKKRRVTNNSVVEDPSNVIDLVDDDAPTFSAAAPPDEATNHHAKQTKKRPRDEMASQASRTNDAEVLDLVDSDDELKMGNNDQISCQSNNGGGGKSNTKTNQQNSQKAVREEVVDLVGSDDDLKIGNNKDTSYNSSGHDSKSGNNTKSNTNTNTTQQNSQKVVLEPNDNAILTQGILDTIHALSMQSPNDCCTCRGSKTGYLSSTDVAALANNEPAFGEPAHIQQTDDWSCGYRNYQMLLSALLPRLTHEHSVFSKLPRRTPPTPISLPSLLQIQSSMESAWNDEGFDPSGAKHYGNSIRGKIGEKAMIGAMEVAHLCWYHGIDVAVVQFIKCHESRRLLPRFVAHYFAQQSTSSSTATNAIELARSILSDASLVSEVAISVPRSAKPSSSHLPLYLQWKGHSVTVVGIEVFNPISSLPHLLVLDPMKKNVHSDLQKAHSLPPSVRLPWQEIRFKDLQIMVCTERSMSYQERQGCKNNPKSRLLTASESAVQRHLRNG